MNTSDINSSMYYPNLDESVRAGMEKTKDPQKAAKQVEVVFLNELLKNMLENTEFGKDKMVSSYMPYITTEISKALSQRGIGIQEFFMKSPAFRDMVSGKPTEAIENKDINSGTSGEGLKMPVRGMLAPVYETVAPKTEKPDGKLKMPERDGKKIGG